MNLGDFDTGKVVRFAWGSNSSTGASITRATNGTISVYKNGGLTQSTTGLTDNEDFDGLTGVHLVAIDTAADGAFYAAGNDFAVILSGATIDGQVVNAPLAHFSIRNRVLGANAINAAAIATDALSAAKASTDLVEKLANGLLDLANGVESGHTVRHVLRIAGAAGASKTNGATPTGGTFNIRDLNDTKNRIVALVDQYGNRLTVTKDLT